jgi:hypothetical protein
VKLCSDAGHDSEIRSVRTAVHQIDIFARVLNARARLALLASGGGGAAQRRALDLLAEVGI